MEKKKLLCSMEIYKDIVITAQFSIGFLNKNNNYKGFLIMLIFRSTVTNVDIENLLLYIPQKRLHFWIYKQIMNKKISYINGSLSIEK